MATIKICPIEDGGIGPLVGPFGFEDCDPGSNGPVVPSIVRFIRWVASGMTFYNCKGGIENSSLLKSYAIECFEELAREEPLAASKLTNLVVICRELPESLKADPLWKLHRAILATLPGVTFHERT